MVERFRSLHRFLSFAPVFWIFLVTTLSVPLLYHCTTIIILRSVRQVTPTTRHDTFYKDSIHYLIAATTTTTSSFSIVPICTAFSVTPPRRFHLAQRQRPSDFVRVSIMADASDIHHRDLSSDGGENGSCCATIIQPLYITIGPPCSGKTTWIRTQNNKDRTNRPAILDICIDDQPGVYYPVATEYILPETFHDAQDETNAMSQQRQREDFLSNIIYGRTIKDRINDQSELCAVLLRFSNLTTKDDFQKSSLLAPTVVEVVEDIICEFESKQQPITLPSTIDLFIIDAIFRRPPPVTSKTSTMTKDDVGTIEDVAPPQSALERTEQWLYDTPVDTPIAYGNTNTRPTDYVKALQMAMKLKRPVHFVVYCDQDSEHFDREMIDLTVENGMQGLIRRNIYRFLQTGRYVPEQVISDMRDRTHDMIHDIRIATQHSVAANVSESSPRPLTMSKKLEFHQQLARIAGFEMNQERIITAAIRDQKLSTQVVRNVNQRNEKKHDRPVTTTTTTQPSRSRPWDRPASAVRGYKGQLDPYRRKQDDPPNEIGPKERK